MKRYFKCLAVDHNGEEHKINIEIKGSVQNLYTLVSLYKKVTIEETDVEESKYKEIEFKNYY